MRRSTNASSVDEFMSALDHPLRSAVQLVRSTILGVSPEVAEEIKWNAPSFHVKEHFATLNIRKDLVRAIFNDPSGLLEWLAQDRAVVKFRDLATVRANKAAFEDIVRQWIARLPR